ncbi:MAG TPA: hypothetical protein PLP19_03325 [bacterium]|nr:hypothetical protein [bacterium]HPN42500.1 hypothetical protein [bacterium]
MCILKQQLLSKYPPQPREVWQVDDLELRLEDPSRKNKYKRPVLILSCKELLKPGITIINVIPFATIKSGYSFDKFTIPIKNGFIGPSNNFKVNNTSAALIRFYQPIDIKFFVEKCGELSEEIYYAIRRSLCENVIGQKINDYNFKIN